MLLESDISIREDWGHRSSLLCFWPILFSQCPFSYNFHSPHAPRPENLQPGQNTEKSPKIRDQNPKIKDHHPPHRRWRCGRASRAGRCGAPARRRAGPEGWRMTVRVQRSKIRDQLSKIRDQGGDPLNRGCTVEEAGWKGDWRSLIREDCNHSSPELICSKPKRRLSVDSE